MTDEQARQIREAAEVAAALRDRTRDEEMPMSGEDWVELDWLADTLLEMDKEIALDALI